MPEVRTGARLLTGRVPRDPLELLSPCLLARLAALLSCTDSRIAICALLGLPIDGGIDWDMVTTMPLVDEGLRILGGPGDRSEGLLDPVLVAQLVAALAVPGMRDAIMQVLDMGGQA